ncbi:MAG TPA: PAS domain S-box protein [Mucilaginibacter sp.]|nr:PAS domain S-box protein [Mucilaginibacter sp.]
MLNNLLTALNDCVWAFDVNTQKILFISPGIHSLVDYTPKDFHQNKNLWNEIIDPRDHDEVLATDNKPVTEEWVEQTYRVIAKSGTIKWVHQKKSLIIDEQTGHQVLLSVIKDVSDQRQINFHMQQSLGDFSLLFNNNPAPMWIYELPTLRILKVNEAAIKHYGYSEQEWLTMTIRDIRPRFDLAKFNDYLYRKGIPESSLHGFNNAGVWKHQNKEGEIIYAEITGHEIKYDNHSCRIIIARDVTEIMREKEDLVQREQFLATRNIEIEKEIKKASDRLNSFIESITDYCFILDNDWKLVRVNTAFEKLVGIPREEIIGRDLWDRFPNILKTGFEPAYSKAINEQTSVQFVEYYQPMNKWFSATIYPSSEGLTIFVRDITDEKHAQEETVWTKNNLEALINNTEDLTWSIDREGKYVYMNTAYRNRITYTVGTAPVEGDDAYAHSGHTAQINKEWRSYYRRALLGERYVTRHESPDPQTKKPSYFEVSFNPIYKKSKDEIIGVGCFARDITERLKNEQALIEQNERLRNIASLSSHELRRPVASMIGLLNILDRQNFHNPENEQIIDHLFTVSHEIDEVIRTIVNKTFIDDRHPL